MTKLTNLTSTEVARLMSEGAITDREATDEMSAREASEAVMCPVQMTIDVEILSNRTREVEAKLNSTAELAVTLSRTFRVEVDRLNARIAELEAEVKRARLRVVS